MPKATANGASDPLLDEAIHTSVRAFRKRLAQFADGRRVVVVGGQRAPSGLFIPIHVSAWVGHAEILVAARRSLRKVQAIARYTGDPDERP